MKKVGIIVVVLMALLVVNNWATNRVALENLDEADVVSTNGLHYHSVLSILIDGESQPIPSNVGLVGGHSPMHTHELDGTVHMEFERGVVTKDDLRLSSFFKIWGKKFNSQEILDKSVSDEGTITMSVNGEDNTEFENYVMQEGDKIEIKYE